MYAARPRKARNVVLYCTLTSLFMKLYVAVYIQPFLPPISSPLLATSPSPASSLSPSCRSVRGRYRKRHHFPTTRKTGQLQIMAKGTLLASAKTTKRGGPAATAKKAAITSTRPAAAAAPAVLASKKAKKAELSSDGVDAASLDGAGPERRKLRTNDPKYSRHYKLVMKESLEGMDLCKWQWLITSAWRESVVSEAS